jgi:hypothetical protein
VVTSNPLSLALPDRSSVFFGAPKKNQHTSRQAERKTAEAMEPNESRPPPSSDRRDAARVPDPEPSDPDAGLYAAARARPDWTTKPAVRALIQELSEGLGPGEDLFFWDVHKPRAAKPSDAKEHAWILLPPAPAPAERPSGLEARRVHVGPGTKPRRSERARPGAVALLVVIGLLLAGVVLGALFAAPRDKRLDGPAPARRPLDAAPRLASPSAGPLPSSSASISPPSGPPAAPTRPGF